MRSMTIFLQGVIIELATFEVDYSTTMNLIYFSTQHKAYILLWSDDALLCPHEIIYYILI